MDDVEYKPGHKISVSHAVWDQQTIAATKAQNNSNCESNPKPKWKEMMTEAEYKAKLKAKRERLNAKLGWNSEAHQKTVILRNVFDVNEIRSNPSLVDILKNDMKAGASEFGALKSLKVAEKNPEGIVILNFKSNMSSNPCIEKMNGRFYGGRTISASLWDGYTNHVVKESEEEKKKREEEFGKWLENVSNDDAESTR